MLRVVYNSQIQYSACTCIYIAAHVLQFVHGCVYCVSVTCFSVLFCTSFYVGQSQHFQVVFERPSIRVLQAKITYSQPLPPGYDFEIVFFNAGNKIHTAAGATETDSQVILISLDNVDTLSSVTARMEFVYSEDRFTGPEITSAIPVFCKSCKTDNMDTLHTIYIYRYIYIYIYVYIYIYNVSSYIYYYMYAYSDLSIYPYIALFISSIYVRT